MHAQLCTFLLLVSPIILNAAPPDTTEAYDRVGNSTPSTTKTPTLPEGYVAFPDIHVAYKFYEENTTWNEARDRCVAEGAHLAIADSVAKVQLIKGLRSGNVFHKWVHVGIYKKNATEPWVRVDNDLPVTSVPWAPYNPDDSGECAGIAISDDGLLDYLCESGDKYYACEIPI